MKEQLVKYWEGNSSTVIDLGYKIFLAMAIVVASVVIARFVKRSIIGANEKMQRIDATLMPLISAMAAYLVYTLGLLIVLDVFGVNTNSIIALLGAAGIAVGLALKDTLSNIAAGIMLLFLRPFTVGDFITCGDVSGSVREIGVFVTVIETADGLYISAPNNSLWGGAIKNFTRNGKRRMEITVGIDYQDSIEVGLKVLLAVAATESRLLADPAPQVMVFSMGDSSINLQLRMWAPVDVYWEIYWAMNRKVKEEIELAGLSIPFPQRTLHVVEPLKL
jgi:small conductance mechanosensitive channel